MSKKKKKGGKQASFHFLHTSSQVTRYWATPGACFASFLLLYTSVVKQKKKKSNGDGEKNRNYILAACISLYPTYLWNKINNAVFTFHKYIFYS